ncbi:MAG TPA: hypothetical protein PK324_02735 [Nocardioides sp.]|nr:hypothetical protein [Nocardioides sp.]
MLTVSTAGNGAGSVASVPGGISCPGDCMETFTHGQMVTLTATPSTGSTFASWSGGGCTGTAPCTVTMTAARSVQATFTLTTHTLTVTKAGTGQALGTVTSMPAGINCGADCNETVNYGTQLTLTASAAAGATFVGWSGGGCNGTGMCVVTVTANTMVTANFEADKTLTVSRAGTGSTYGLVTATGINCGNDCTEPYPHDSFVQLTASVPVAAAATFSGWSGGGCSGAQATCTVRMDMAQMVTATFNIRQHTVSVATNGGNGAGTVASTPMGIMAPTTPSASFNYGTTVTLAASPSTGSNFTGWSGVSGCSGTGSCDVLVDGAKAVTATFTLQQFALSVSKTGTSTALATVTSTPAGINCGATCSSMFNYNTPVQLSVSFMPGVRFMGWSGEGCTGTGTCSVTMTQARNVSAAFEGDKVLSVTVNGNGSGSVISAPAGIMTPAMTSAAYTHGTSVTLTAAANTTTSNFAGWSGSCASAGTNAQCVVTMDQARDVTATFTLKTYTLTLNKSGAGVGTVTSDVAGINCGTACPTQNATYNHGQTVVLSHVAGADSQFVAWGGACTGANCSVSMVADQTVTANFKRTDKTLTVSVAGNGSGTVTSNPAGIDAPTDGTETYAHDTMVTLTANTDTVTSNFAGWSGACTGTMLTCSVTMDQARSVTATFTLKTYTLTLNKSGAGAGTVTSNPAGINCGTTCSTQNATYNHGQSVTLSQLASTGSEFVAWGGACGGAMCTVVMTQDRTVTANFKLTDKTLTVSVAGNGAGTVTSNPAGINAPTDGTETYLHGTMVTLTANPDTVTSNFAGWSGGCTGTMLTCSVTMDQARSVTATFTLKTYTLTLNKTGAGVGTVSSNPAGINCGTACATQNATYNHGQSVTLSHLAGADSEFVAWGGACGGATCTVAMTQDRTVTANFKRTDKTLTVNVTGSGTVTSMDGGINAPSDPTHTYAHGTTVMLMAAWNATSHDFVWGGACAGSLATCSVTMDQAQTVTATFTLKNWTLTVAKAGVVAAAGTVTSTMPAGAINCGADCSETVTHGTMVTLTATPGTGDIFFGWSGGGCSGTGSCTTTVTAATMVTATFDNCVRSTQSCSNGLFSQCGTNGDWVTHSIPNGSATGGQLTIPMQNYACPMLACHASQPRCIDISASNGLNAALDAPEVSPTGLDVSLDASSPAGGANIIIDTNNFSAGTGTTRITLADGSSLDVPAIVVEQPATMMTPQGPDILVLKTRTFTVRPSTFVEVRGTRALGIVANFDIFIGGTIDASANEYTSGAGASLVSTCAGTQNATASGGGGNWDPGGASTSGAAGGAILSAGFVVPLQGGCRGGMIVVSAGNTWVGGSPGGAIQFVSRRRTAISPTGLLNVNGGGGFAGVDSSVFQGRASGGGSGGGILIESPSVTIDPGGVFSGRGGSGSAASFGGNVAHGTEYNPVTGAGAASVSCTSCGTSGAGGTESAQPGNATGSSSARAGGGGSVGRTVFRNQNGVVSIPGGALRIRHQLLTLPTRSPP